MATWLVVLLFSVGAVVLFAVGMSLTLIFKGHHIDSEIATNRHMRERGISCAAQDARRSSRAVNRGGNCAPTTVGEGESCSDICGEAGCGSDAPTPLRGQTGRHGS